MRARHMLPWIIAAATIAPARLHAVDPATYIFHGCLVDVSCHEVTLTVTPSTAPGYVDVSTLIFSQFLVPARVAAFDVGVPTNDPEFGVDGSAFPATAGEQTDFAATYADAGWTPAYFRIVIGVAGPGDEDGWRQQDLRELYLTPVSAFPEPPISTVPEPGTFALVATGLVGLGVRLRRRRPD